MTVRFTAEETAVSMRAVDLQRLGHRKWKRGQALSLQWHKIRAVTANELLQPLLPGNLYWCTLGCIQRCAQFKRAALDKCPLCI